MKPSILGRLQETDTAYVVDPQSLRFVTDSYQEVGALRKLPYAPSAPLQPGGSVEQFVVDALKFQDEAGASAYVVPGTPIYGARDGWQELNAAVHWIAASKNGRDVASKPLVAYASLRMRLGCGTQPRSCEHCPICPSRLCTSNL
jgi:hypothetical protein